MKTKYAGIKHSNLRFENLEPGDMFIIKPTAGAPDPERAIIYMRVWAEDGLYNTVSAGHGHLCNLNDDVQIIKLDGELNWKTCE